MIKLKKLDELLQSSHGYTMKELKEALGVSSNDTVRKMLGYKNGKVSGIRQGVDWPVYLREKYNPDEINIIDEIEVAGKKRYLYSKDDFSLFNEELTSHVIENLLPILERLNQIEGISSIYINELEKIYEVIERQRNGFYKDRLEKIESGKKLIFCASKKVFNIDENFNDPGFIAQICSAISKEIPLEILYIDPKDNESRIICHPYLMVEGNERWYLIGHIEKAFEEDSVFIKNDRVKKINPIGVERIHEIIYRENIKYIKPVVDIFKLLNDSMGHSIETWEDPNRIKLVLELDKNLVFYFKTKAFIGNGIKESLKDNIYTHPSVVKSLELTRKILSFGCKIKVLEPIDFRDEIKEELEKAIQNY